VARADGLAPTLPQPRTLGRAGVSTVSCDSGGLLDNPGGMVRRSQARLLLSTRVDALDQSYSAPSASSPEIRSQAGAKTLPSFAYHHGAGRWVFGLQSSYAEREVSHPLPSFDQPEDDVTRLFPHRYAGLSSRLRERSISLGAAARVGEWLGVGASATLWSIHLQESRHAWAGFTGRDQALSPSRDIALRTDMQSDFLPGLNLGALIAPPELPLEFALAGSVRAPAKLTGDAVAERTRADAYPLPVGADPRARLSLPTTASVRAGARYLGRTIIAEVNAELALAGGRAPPVTTIEGLSIQDQTGAEANLDRVPSFVSERNHFALRASLEYELVGGFIWLTGGYGYRSPPTSRSYRSAAYARLGGHTAALGLEAVIRKAIITVGFARTFSRIRTIGPGQSRVEVVSPFDSGLGETMTGELREARSQLGLAIELAFE
jgi:hypothetical protein